MSLIYEPRILTECYGDTMLIESLGYKPNDFHAGINEIARLMQKKYTNNKAIGVIDDDKKKGEYFSNFVLFRKKIDGVSVWKHKTREHYSVILHPVLENWLWDSEYEVGIDRRSYRLPSADGFFRKMIKNQSIRKNSNFKNYLNSLRAKKSRRFLRLQATLHELLK